jgi:hypothetical protein
VVIHLQVRREPGRYVGGEVGLGGPELGVETQRIRERRAGGVRHDHHGSQPVVRGGEPVEHGGEATGEDPVLRPARLSRDQHQHRKPRPR